MEAEKRTIRALNDGLQAWVDAYNASTANGNDELAEEIRNNIQERIEQNDLVLELVYGRMYARNASGRTGADVISVKDNVCPD